MTIYQNVMVILCNKKTITFFELLVILLGRPVGWADVCDQDVCDQNICDHTKNGRL